MNDAGNNLFADLFPPVPKKFLEMLLEHCDKSLDAGMIHGGVYLKRFAELGLIDLESFCGRLNYVFFAGHSVFDPDLFGRFTVSEAADAIKQKSALGSVLDDE